MIKSILDTSRTGGGRRDEIFVDIVEKISCTFNSAGSIQTSQIDGSVQVPSCLASAQDLCLPGIYIYKCSVLASHQHAVPNTAQAVQRLLQLPDAQSDSHHIVIVQLWALPCP